MTRDRALSLCFILAITTCIRAQVVAPVEIGDAGLRKLQLDSMSQLNTIAQSLAGHRFDFPFYFSRRLDIDEKQQQRIDQHSIRFDHFEGATVLAISGNYYGAYPAEKFSEELRARRTFLTVVLPIVQAAVPAVGINSEVQGYAVEVSYHVVGRTMGMPIERAENLMVYLPQRAAQKLVTAQDQFGQQAALLEAEVFLNSNPFNIWLTDDRHPAESETKTRLVEVTPAPLAPAKSQADWVEAVSQPPATAVQPTPKVADPAPAELRDTSSQALALLLASVHDISSKMVKELDSQAHFIAYAPPAFIAFRHKVYLELSIESVLGQPASASRYRLAALEFDENVSPLIRRTLGYFPGSQDFDGISFSATVHARLRPGVAATRTLSVEFFLPLHALRCYDSYDCTGQQLLDAGVVLVNGERVGLDLQLAEGGSQP